VIEDLIIVGAGGSSREIAGAVEDLNRIVETWRLLGFLDDDPSKSGAIVDGYPVLGTTSAANRYPTCRFIVGIASARDPWRRKLVVERLGLPRDRYATLVHPSASISRYASIGAGTAILQNVVITPDTTIGSHVIISQGVLMAHDQELADFVTIAPGAVVAGGVRLHQGVYVGAGSVIIQGVSVGEGALVGIGSVVTNHVPAGVTVLGNPARRLPLLRRAR
jgi:sugar O-acyltransferase (sialic acid O-acetyltransferase NeuD family)